MKTDPTRYYAEFRSRLKAMREEAGHTQEQMATALGVSLAVYQKYEVRSKFPPHLLEKLALVARRDLYFVVTGKPPTIRAVREMSRAG